MKKNILYIILFISATFSQCKKEKTTSITPGNTIALTSAAATSNQTIYIDSVLATITYTTTGATGATFSGLPAGINGSWVADKIIISGTPTLVGTFDYIVTTTGGGTAAKANGTITVLPTPKEKIIEIKTAFGTMYMWLYKETPLHRANFLKLADSGFFDSITFHRIISNFMIQGGDPNTLDTDSTNDGYGGPGYTIPAEFITSLKHDYGAVGAARDNNPQKESNGSQFYIVENKTGAHHLDKSYTVFGKVFSGIDVAVTIAKQPKNANDRPYTDIRMDVNVIEKTLAELKTEFNFVP